MMRHFSNVIFFFACLFSVQAQESFIKPTVVSPQPTLKSLLVAHSVELDAKTPPKEKKINAEVIQFITEKEVIQKAQKLKSIASNFELQNAEGETVSLAQLLKSGPVVLTWYRGGWSSYCNITLSELQKHLKEFKIYNATLLALSPECQDKLQETKKVDKLDFELLWDAENKVASQYGLVYKLTPDAAKMYQKEFALHDYNKSKSDELPLTATYVIDTKGTIRYAFVSSDYRERAEPAAIIEVLKRLK